MTLIVPLVGFRCFRLASRATMAWVVAAALLSAGSARGQCQYSVTVLPELDCFFGGLPVPVAINNLGHVIGYYDCGAGRRAALWTGGTQWQTLPLPPEFDAARPYGLNDLDEIVGEALDTVPAGGGATIDYTYACLCLPGQPPRLLGVPAGGNYSIATGVNRHSEICGYWGNRAFGGGVSIDKAGDVQIINCTIAANTSSRGGGIGQEADSGNATLVRSSILWGNTSGNGAEIWLGTNPGAMSIDYSDIRDRNGSGVVGGAGDHMGQRRHR